MCRNRIKAAWNFNCRLQTSLPGSRAMLESFDPDIYSLGHIVSGHTLKHLAAAGSTYFTLLMLQRRTCIISRHFRPASTTARSGLGWLVKRQHGKINRITAKMSDFDPEVLPYDTFVSDTRSGSVRGGNAK